MKYKWIIVAVLITLFISPAILLLITGFSSRWVWPELFPDSFSSHAIGYVIREAPSIGKNLAGSFLYSIATVIFSFLLSFAPASVLSREEFTGKQILKNLFLLPVLIPSITFAMGIHTLFIHWGLTDTFWGVVFILTIFSYPYMLRALEAGFTVTGESYGRTAKNLGAGNLAVLLGIELPLLLPAAVAGGSIVFLVAFSEYFLVFLIGGGTVPSYSGYLFPFLLSSDRQTASLLSIIFLILPIGLFFILDATVLHYYRKRGMV